MKFKEKWDLFKSMKKIGENKKTLQKRINLAWKIHWSITSTKERKKVHRAAKKIQPYLKRVINTWGITGEEIEKINVGMKLDLHPYIK